MGLALSCHTQETQDEEFYVVSLHDYVPIIGTVKNTCEAVAALCLGDPKTAAEKGIDVDEDTLSEFLVIKGADEESAAIILQTILEDGKKEVRDTKSLIQAHKMTLGNLSEQRLLWKPAFIPVDLKPKGHKRGEHVINNGVLKVYQNIREKFIKGGYGTGNINPPIDPFTPDCRTAIGSKMVVHFMTNQHYIDPNSVTFGEMMFELSNSAFQYMKFVFKENEDEITSERNKINRVVEKITGEKVFIDEKALAIWKKENPREKAMFENAKREVIKMYENLKCHKNNHNNNGETDLLYQWVTELTKQS